MTGHFNQHMISETLFQCEIQKLELSLIASYFLIRTFEHIIFVS